MPLRAIHFGSLDFILDQEVRNSTPRVLSKNTILMIMSFVFWIDGVQVTHLEQLALLGVEEPMPRPLLETSVAF